MKIAVAADHGGFEMKQVLVARLRSVGHEVTDFGATRLIPTTTTLTTSSHWPGPYRPARSTAGSSSAAVASGLP